MLTAFTEAKIKVVFLLWLVVLLLISVVIRNIHLKVVALLIPSVAYGVILAKWYTLNPLENKFGDNGIFDSIGIVLSAVMFLIPLCFLSSQDVKEKT